MSTYKLCKAMIQSGRIPKETMLEKLDVFYAAGRLTEAEYTELVKMTEER